MGKAFLTGAERQDWLFSILMQNGQLYTQLEYICRVAATVSPGTVYVIPGVQTGGYAAVVCVYDAGFNVVSIQGTYSNTQLIVQDVMASAPVPVAGVPGQVHAGFALQAALLQKAVAAKVMNGQPTIYTGHSLGGATAIIMAAVHQRNGVEVAGAYVAGSPKPGTAGFASRLGFPVINLINDGDIVPSLPQGLGSLGLPFFLLSPLSNTVLNSFVQAGSLQSLLPSGVISPNAQLLSGPAVIASVLGQGFNQHLATSYAARLRIGVPQPTDVLACAHGYPKPWFLYHLDDPKFAPHPPYPLVPCVGSEWSMRQNVLSLTFLGKTALLSSGPWKPPTIPSRPPDTGLPLYGSCCA